MTTPADPKKLLTELREIVGVGHVLSDPRKTLRFRRGFRSGSGAALAVVRPGILLEQWRVLRACVAADATIIFQASNTGLTGGSTPDGDDYPAGVVIINTMRMSGIHLVAGGRQVICLPGTTLYQLERMLRPLGREPHSVIGSSCLGASVLGGVCNNSGGALVRRGPSFTELALFARVDPDGVLELVNHLGVRLGDDPEEVLDRVQRGTFDASDVEHDPARHASDHEYADHVREVDADTPARYNADPRRLFEASGSAGKLALFAVRLDTFAAEEETATFYIGTNDPGELTQLRRDILSQFGSLPVAGEYVHRAAFDIAAIYGKDTFLAIQYLGTDRLPTLFALQAKAEALADRIGFRSGFIDRMMQRVSAVFPQHLPARLLQYRDRFEHHLMLKMSGAGIGEARDFLSRRFPTGNGDFFGCTPDEGAKAFQHRFAVAGAAVRYRAVHRESVEDIVALDIALPRNTRDWFETLPDDLEQGILHKLYYGHFFCQVFHQDYVVAKGVDPIALEHRMWDLLDVRGAQYPAEHNVGHLYKARPTLEEFYRQIDPRNQLNPGIGQTPRSRHWGDPNDC